MPSDYARIEHAINWLRDHYRENPGLAELAEILQLSPAHTQRLFRRWAGITPNQFIQFLSTAFAKELLREQSVLHAAYLSGLSSPGRLHDRMINIEAVSPGEFKSGGENLTIKTACFESPFGPTFLATSHRGILRLAFTEDTKSEIERLAEEWPNAEARTEDLGTEEKGRQLFSTIQSGGQIETPLVVRGTNFQVKVWKALLDVEQGNVTTYQAIARAIGKPKASRAVGSAVGANPIALLIPCHRVIKADGEIGNYHWGAERKNAILAWESGAKIEANSLISGM